MALKVEVVSRERTVWTGEANYVRARSVDGELGILPGMIPTCALLAQDGELLIEPVEGETIKTTLNAGFLTVSNDHVTIAAKHAQVSASPGLGDIAIAGARPRKGRGTGDWRIRATWCAQKRDASQ